MTMVRIATTPSSVELEGKTRGDDELAAVVPPLAMFPRAFAPIPGRPRIKVIAAELDEFAPAQDVQRFAERMHAELIVVAGADHFFSRADLGEIVEAACD